MEKKDVNFFSMQPQSLSLYASTQVNNCLKTNWIWKGFLPSRLKKVFPKLPLDLNVHPVVVADGRGEQGRWGWEGRSFLPALLGDGGMEAAAAGVTSMS